MISHPRTHKGAVLIAAYVMFAADRGVRDVCLRSGITVGQPDITHQRRARR